MTVLAITGTSTDVGKTIATAALSAAARSAGVGVAVCKPAQTGVSAAEPGDLDEVRRLAGDVTARECYRYPEPLAPDTASRRAQLTPVDLDVVVAAISELASTHDVTLVEGAGGVLVRLAEHITILDVAARSADGVVVVVQPGLGALNHAELTVDAIRARGLRPAGLVLGWWPESPDLAMRCNRTDLPRVTGVPIVGTLPQHAASTEPARFRASASSWFDPDWLRAELLAPAAVNPSTASARTTEGVSA